MKVLVIPSWYSTERNKIAGVFVSEQCKALIKRDIEVNILFADLYLINMLNPFKWYRNSYIHERGISIYRVHGFFLPKRSLLITKWWSNIYTRLFSLYKRQYQNPHFIHAHSYFAGMAALSIKREYGIPYVITEHHSGFINNSLPVWHLAIVREVLDNADAIIALNANLKIELQKHTTKDVIIIPNLIDTSVFNYKERHPSNVFKLIAVGFLIKRKGHDILIDAISQILNNKRMSVEIELIIIGEGIERNHLEKLIKYHSLTNVVRLIGNVDHELLPDYLHKSDLFVSASYAETQGVAISQALCMGLPVISTDVGGLKESINQMNGILIPTGNVNALSNAIEYMVNNYTEYDRKAISDTAMKIYDPDLLAEKLKGIYANLATSG